MAHDDDDDAKTAAIGHLREALGDLVAHIEQAEKQRVPVDADRSRWRRLVDDAAHALSATSGPLTD